MRCSLALLAGLVACEPALPSVDLIFQNGRAVAPAGDTVLAYTASELDGFVVVDRRTDGVDTLGATALTSPFHIQEHHGHWFVSDFESGRAYVVELTAQGDVVRRIDVDTLASAPHQFAVLPDGRIVLESSAGRLVALTDDSVTTFAIVAQGPRTGLLIAAQGGVVHAMPTHAVTLYNAHGNVRWRLPWPWSDSAFVSDLAVDAHHRMHVLAGEQGRQGFVVFSLSPLTGEVVRWSEMGPYATFVVNRVGEIQPIEE